MLKLKAEIYTEVYLNGHGGIVITQPYEGCQKCGTEHSAVVLITASQARKMANALSEYADQAEQDELLTEQEGCGSPPQEVCVSSSQD
jgi:hypothetical protein